MQPFEKYSPKRIQKDVSPDAVDGAGNRRFAPGDLLDAVNCRYEGLGSDGRIKSVKGNQKQFLALPAGTNQVIGSISNEAANTIIYFIWNDQNVDRVVEYQITENIFTVLLQGDLGFDKTYPINDGGVLGGDIVLWNDKLNRPRSISLIKARAGGYVAPFSEYELSLATRPPMKECTVVPSTDATLAFNNLTGNTWQITHRYVYFDDRISTVGPYSKLVWIRPFVDNHDTNSNELTVTVPFPTELAGIVSKIEVIAREGNSNNFFIFEEIKNPTVDTFTVKFNNFGKKVIVAPTEINRLYDYIPDRSEGFEVLRDRVFSTLNATGFDVDESTFDIVVTLVAEAAPAPNLGTLPLTAAIASTPEIRRGGYQNKRYLKGGGSYVIGVVFKDDFGKTSFVKKQKRVTVPFDHTMGHIGNRYTASVAITGVAPAGMVSYEIVISDELFYQSQFQARLMPLLYVREIGTGEADNHLLDNGLFTWKGKVFYNMFAQADTTKLSVDQAGVKYIYWQLPQNSAFVPDASCFIRFTTGFATGLVSVLGVVGSYLVTEYDAFKSFFAASPPLITDNGIALEVWRVGIIAEILKLKESSSPEKFYEIGHTYDIVSGGFATSPITVYGDTYNVYLILDAAPIYDVVAIDNEVHASFFDIDSRNRPSFVESPSGLFSSSSPTLLSSSGNAGTGGAFDQYFYKASLDYTKAANDHGRVHTVYDKEKRKDLFNIVGFSNPYTSNTFINGLNTFLAENQYPLPVERSKIRGLKKAGDVMLAIHQTDTTSLYIGQGFIRQGNDFILAKTEGVIGDNRELNGKFGTINPESIKSVNDNVFWWDALKGAVIRYTNAGMFPISNYGMKAYFRKKAKDYAPYRNSIKIVTGFDYTYDEFLITFPQVGSITAETWAFNINTNEWKTRYDFIPEWYGQTSLDLVTYKNGEFWLHEKNVLCNNFYGIQYTRRFKFVCNSELGKDKRWLNLHIKMAGQTPLATDMNSETVVVRMANSNGQASYLPALLFKLDQGKWVSEILKDTNTPVTYPQIALQSGVDLVSDYLEVEIENNRLDEAPLTHVNVVYKHEEFSV